MNRTISRAGSAMAVLMISVVLAGCSSLPWVGRDSSPSPAAGAMRVEVVISSDADTAAELRVEIDAPEDPQHVDDENVPLPYSEQFDVALNVPFPLKGVSVEATAAPGAEWVECQVLLDGEVISEDRAEGSEATATCEKELRLGPQ